MLLHVGKLSGTMGTSTFTGRPPIMETNGQRGSWAKLGTLKCVAYESIKTHSQSCDGVIGHGIGTGSGQRGGPSAATASLSSGWCASGSQVVHVHLGLGGSEGTKRLPT